MSTKSQMVFRGYLELSESEKQEFREELKEYDDAQPDVRQTKELVTAIRVAIKMELGPISNGCPCCGK